MNKNKYQKALNDLVRISCIKRKSCDECKIRKVCNSEAKSYIDTLQELIDKTTSTKQNSKERRKKYERKQWILDR